jgi:hypothetical protein
MVHIYQDAPPDFLRPFLSFLITFFASGSGDSPASASEETEPSETSIVATRLFLFAVGVAVPSGAGLVEPAYMVGLGVANRPPSTDRKREGLGDGPADL